MTGMRQTSRNSPPCHPFSLPSLPFSYYPFSGEDFNPNPKPHLTLLSLYLEVPDWLLGALACLTTASSFLVTSLAHLPSTYVFSRWLCRIISPATLVSCMTSNLINCVLFSAAFASLFLWSHQLRDHSSRSRCNDTLFQNCPSHSSCILSPIVRMATPLDALGYIIYNVT